MRNLKVTDYIVEFLIEKQIKHVFGYPGGSIANLMDSLCKYKDKIEAHATYHEQAAAFAACGYARTSGTPGMAYAIGGPGATNLVTGIAHAFYDSIPLICITGNANTYESSRKMSIRQRAFQECEIIPIVSSITKYCAYIDSAQDVKYHLERAYYHATEGRMGPVLLDLPMDVARAVIDVDDIRGFVQSKKHNPTDLGSFKAEMEKLIADAKRPCFIIGNGAKTEGELLKTLISSLGIPCVTSMIAFDAIGESPLYYGFLGASGSRAANFIVAKSDLVIALGSRLDIRQTGAKRTAFAPNAKIVRVDIDEAELGYKVHNDEISFCMDTRMAMNELSTLSVNRDYADWLHVCNIIREKTRNLDMRTPNRIMAVLSEKVPDGAVITTDVGQNQVWTAQNFKVKNGQSVLFSGGFGAMGHALPAAIGAYYGSGGTCCVSICGDGGIQMNIQELQFLARENIPVKVVIFNNYSLGMIRHFQETWFNGVYFQTKEESGYSAPSFCNIAKGYGIDSVEITSLDDIELCDSIIQSSKPGVIEIQLYEDTYEYPKLKFGNPNQDQEPPINRVLYEELMNL